MKYVSLLHLERSSLCYLWLFLQVVKVVNDSPSVASISGRENIKSVLESIDGDTIAHHVNILSSDAFEGRRPTTRGENLTLSYLAGELKRYGVEPALEDGYLQAFPMSSRSVTFTGSLGNISL